MEPPIPYRGTVSWQLFKRAQWRHVGARWLFLFVFPVFMTATAYLSSGPMPMGILILVVIAATAFVPFMLGFMVLQWRRTYRQSPLLHTPLAGSVSPDKFVAEGVTGRTEMTWSQFVRIRDADDVVLLYQSPNVFMMLAREFFESDAAWETARSFATRKRPDS